MPLALLLSPDDQAVSAITAVLEEMAVTCERPLDGPSAAKKLNSHNFDLVLVDCENLPAAKLIFDVCRRTKGGNSPVAIAIVDGRAGLPTAFRLGAELILTKPVAKDQARSTIRSAVGRVRKEEPARPSENAEPVIASVARPKEAELPTTSAGSTEALLSHHESAPDPAKPAPPAAPRAMAAAASSQPAATLAPAHEPTSSNAAKSSPAIKMSAAPSAATESEIAPSPKASTVLYETKVAPSSPRIENSEVAESERDSEPAPPPSAPVFSAYAETGRPGKARGPLVALLVLALAGGGLYAAWMYVPEFRTRAQPQVDRVLALAGMAQKAAPSPTPVKAVPAPPVASAQTPQPAASDTLASTPTPSTTAGAAADASSSPAAEPAKTSVLPAQNVAPTTVPAGSGNTESSKSVTSQNPGSPNSTNNKNGGLAVPAETELQGEKTAVILSSKGAEKRLIHSVQPRHSAEARAAEAEGTIVLKAVVDEYGKVVAAKLVEGDPGLGDSAIKAVKQWRYRPYVRDGKAMSFQTIILIDVQQP